MIDEDKRRHCADADAQIDELGGMGFALAMQMLRNHEDAADAVQDALQRLLRKRYLFDPARGEMRSWFLKIVRNRCLDLLRRQARAKTVSGQWHDASAPAHEQPDRLAEKRELLNVLKKELMEMAEDQRELILLRDYHELSYAEIARVLSIPMGTVMSRLHRSREVLRRRMDKYR